VTVRVSLLVLLAAWGQSCAGGMGPSAGMDGRTRVYEDGLPDFDLEAIPDPDYPDDSIRVHVGLIPASLVFQPAARGYRATFEVQVLVEDRVRLQVEDSLVVETLEESRTYGRHRRTLTVAAVAGQDSFVEVRLLDRSTEQSVIRKQRFGPVSGPHADLWPVQLVDGDGPVLSLHVRAGARGLRAETTLKVRDAGCLKWMLFSAPTDSTTATAPFLLTPSYGSLSYRGANYSRADTLIRVTERMAPGTFSARWPLPTVRSGVHRVNAAWLPDCLADGDPPSRLTQRNFLVRPAEYPRLTHLDQLIDALDYIATPKEMTDIRQAGDAVARKKRFDAFWGRTSGNPRAASDALGRYYSRVEEANRAYSGFKEGWKTDRGMVFIVMGPPLFTEDSIDELRWFYSYDDRNPGRYFVFDRVRGLFDDFNLPHYVLTRSMDQEREWRLAVRRWRRGVSR
jgi:GWxTD domain-containing protein